MGIVIKPEIYGMKKVDRSSIMILSKTLMRDIILKLLMFSGVRKMQKTQCLIQNEQARSFIACLVA